MRRGHIPIRTCIGCRRRRPAKEMIRLKAVGDTVVIISHRHHEQPGRGCYVCPRAECLDVALKKGRLSKALRRNITDPPSREGLLSGLEREGVTGWLC